MPAVVSVIEQLPADTVAVQLSGPEDTVTLPVGVPVAGDTGVTVNATVTGVPGADGSGVSAVIAVVVCAWFTVCTRVSDVLVVKLPSPAYTAVSKLVPTVVTPSVHDPADTVA